MEVFRKHFFKRSSATTFQTITTTTTTTTTAQHRKVFSLPSRAEACDAALVTEAEVDHIERARSGVGVLVRARKPGSPPEDNIERGWPCSLVYHAAVCSIFYLIFAKIFSARAWPGCFKFSLDSVVSENVIES